MSRCLQTFHWYHLAFLICHFSQNFPCFIYLFIFILISCSSFCCFFCSHLFIFLLLTQITQIFSHPFFIYLSLIHLMPSFTMSLFFLISHPVCLIRCDGALTQLSYVRLKDHGTEIKISQVGKAREINPGAGAICSHEKNGERGSKTKEEKGMQKGLTCL